MSDQVPLTTAPRSDDMPKGPANYDPHTAARCFILATDEIYCNERVSPQYLAAHPELRMRKEVHGIWKAAWKPTGTQAMAQVEASVKAAMLVFRGTNDLSDVAADVTFMTANAEYVYDNANIENVYDGDACYGECDGTTLGASLRTVLNPLNWVRTPQTSRGMTKRGIKYTRWLEEVVAQEIDGGVDALESLVVTGHSLGGAAANAFAFWFAKAHPNVRLSVYIFEAPRLGNARFAEEYLKLVPHTFAHVFDVDIVPAVTPWMTACYAHKIHFILNDRFKLLGCNPLNWIMTLHLDSRKVFVPWMKAAYPGVYEKAWESMASQPVHFNDEASTLGVMCAEDDPDNPTNLSTSQFEAIWIDQNAEAKMCFYRIAKLVATVWMSSSVVATLIALAAMLISPPAISFGKSVGAAFLMLLMDPVFLTKLETVVRLVATIGISAVVWLTCFSVVGCFPRPASRPASEAMLAA